MCQSLGGLMRRRDWTMSKARFAISSQRQRYGFCRVIAQNADQVVAESHESRKTVLRHCLLTQMIRRLSPGQRPCNRAKKRPTVWPAAFLFSFVLIFWQFASTTKQCCADPYCLKLASCHQQFEHGTIKQPNRQPIAAQSSINANPPVSSPSRTRLSKIFFTSNMRGIVSTLRFAIDFSCVGLSSWSSQVISVLFPLVAR